MTIRDLLDAGIEFEGFIKVQCWEDENNPNIYYEGYYLRELEDKYKDREISYIFSFSTAYSSAICIELAEES